MITYHEKTNGIAFGIAVLTKARREVVADRDFYRQFKRSTKATLIIDHAIKHLRDRWNRLNARREEWMSELQDNTPKEVAKRMRRSREKALKARKKWNFA